MGVGGGGGGGERICAHTVSVVCRSELTTVFHFRIEIESGSFNTTNFRRSINTSCYIGGLQLYAGGCDLSHN